MENVPRVGNLSGVPAGAELDVGVELGTDVDAGAEEVDVCGAEFALEVEADAELELEPPCACPLEEGPGGGRGGVD